MGVIIIVQARLSSTRLPRKVLMPFGDEGETVLDCVMKRCIETGFNVVVAIPDNEPELAEYCKQHFYSYFEGHPTNLTKRYLDCARAWDAETIIRITADCPLINTELIKLTFYQFTRGYLGFHFPGLNVEVFDMFTLKQAARYSPDEHCTTWMRKQKSARNIESYELNTLEDYNRLLEI